MYKLSNIRAYRREKKSKSYERTKLYIGKSKVYKDKKCYFKQGFFPFCLTCFFNDKFVAEIR